MLQMPRVAHALVSTRMHSPHVSLCLFLLCRDKASLGGNVGSPYSHQGESLAAPGGGAGRTASPIGLQLRGRGRVKKHLSHRVTGKPGPGLGGGLSLRDGRGGGVSSGEFLDQAQGGGGRGGEAGGGPGGVAFEEIEELFLMHQNTLLLSDEDARVPIAARRGSEDGGSHGVGGEEGEGGGKANAGGAQKGQQNAGGGGKGAGGGGGGDEFPTVRMTISLIHASSMNKGLSLVSSEQIATLMPRWDNLGEIYFRGTLRDLDSTYIQVHRAKQTQETQNTEKECGRRRRGAQSRS